MKVPTNIPKKIVTPFALALLLSLALHLAFLYGLSGIGGFDLFSPIPDKAFFADLIAERPHTHGRVKAHFAPPHSAPVDNSVHEAVGEQAPAADTGNVPASLKTEETEKPAGDAPLESPPLHVSESGTRGEPAQVAKADVPLQTEAQIHSPANGIEVLKPLRERLDYNIYWLGINVGKATLEASKDKGAVKLTSRVRSTQFISNFYKVEDHAESMLVNGAPSNFRIKQREGKYRSDKETVFDIVNRKIVFFNYLKGTKDEHTFNGPLLWDVISGFYYLRTLPFHAGSPIFIDIFDSNKFLKAEVSILGKERITLFDKREVDTVIVKPSLKSDGLFQNKGEILIWLTADENRIPVRVETKVPIGKVVAELKSLSLEKEE